ncbi:hypothetical protein Ade02nite_95300 [Paractinoplanes deccanensis]|uniref:VTT domain-containing protein n=1 Tax=Paractinoplanes deccanensis TaxID=113561 RepID=A0ABQ3YLL2_9ACTN|nr:DedA family protein [Actinoplanes deccanensis]GID80889.1 hypothetical protein Ade02nite_95300 [Actinoplanes deccanensis]
MHSDAGLPPLLRDLAPILDDWGYIALFVIIFVESFGLPTPGQTLMVAAAIYSHWGQLDVWLVAAVAFAAAVLGDNLGYWIGARGGRRAVHRWGRYVFLTPPRFAKIEGFFARRGSYVVVVARFFDGLRQFNGVLAGITAMPWRRFLLHNTIGAALWVGVWVSAAYFFGSQLLRILDLPWWMIGLVVAGAGAAVWLGARLLRRPART